MNFKEVGLITIIASVFGAAHASSVITSKAYVDAMDDTKVDIAQGTGDNNANVGKTLVVDSSGDLVLGTPSATNYVEDSITDGVTNKAPSENAVHDALALKQNQIPANNATFEGISLPGLVATTDSAGTVGEVGIFSLLALMDSGTDLETYAEELDFDPEALTLYDAMVPSYAMTLYMDNHNQSKLGGTVDSTNMAGKVVMATDTAGVVDYKAIDSEPTNSSNNLVTSGGVYSALQSAVASIDGLPAGSANQVLQYNGTTSAWESTTMDTTPTQSSVKPVTSGGVKTYVDSAVATKQDKIPANNFTYDGTSYPSLVATTDSAGTVNQVGLYTASPGLDTTSPEYAAVASELGMTVADLIAAENMVPSMAVFLGTYNEMYNDENDRINNKQDKLGGSGNGGKVVVATDTAGEVTYTTVNSAVDTSSNLITSGGVKTYVDSAVATKQDKIPANSFTAQGMSWPSLVATTDSAGTVGEIGLYNYNAVLGGDTSMYPGVAADLGMTVADLTELDSMVPSMAFFSAMDQQVAKKQNRQIGAAPVDSNSVSTDVGKVLVVDNGGKIAMGSVPDSTPTNSSNNLVTSGGVYNAVNAKQTKKICAGWPDGTTTADSTHTDSNCWLWNMPD